MDSESLLESEQDTAFFTLPLKQHVARFAEIGLNSASVILAYLLEMLVMTLNLHVAGSWSDQKFVAALGLATVLLHSLGGTVAQGFNQGYVTFAGRAFGQKNLRAMQGYNLKQIICLGMCFIILSGLMLLSKEILLLAQQDPEVAELSARFGLWLLPAFFFFYIFDFLRSHLNSMQVFSPVTFILLISSAFHITVSLYFKGWEFYGPIGCTTLSYFLAMSLEILYLAMWNPMPGSLSFPGLEEAFKGFGSFLKQQTFLMMPQFLDVFSFEINALIVGSFAIAEMTAAHVAIANLIATLYSFSFGVGGAVCAMCSNAIGKNQPNYIRGLYVYSCTWSVILALAFFSILSIPESRNLIFKYYTTNQQTLEYMVKAILIYKWFFLFDYIQGSTSSFLKSFGYGQSLMWSYIIVYYLIGVSLAFIFAVWLDLQIRGIWLSFGCAILSICLFIQFKLYRTDWTERVEERWKEVRQEATEQKKEGQKDGDEKMTT